MALEIRVPDLGEGVEDGLIVEWLVRVGERVRVGDVLFQVETDKAVSEFESPVEGVLETIVCEAGTTVSVGTVVAYVTDT